MRPQLSPRLPHPKTIKHTGREEDANMTTKVVEQQAVSAALIGRWEQLGQKLAALAEEVPENKFNYRPVDGVRTFADVLRHVAFWNRYVAESAYGRKADDTAN